MSDFVSAAISKYEGASGGRAAVQLTLRNVSVAEVLIDPFNMCADGELNAPIFVIRDSQNKNVKYKGKIFKRGEPDFSKFFKIPAGKEISQICNLDKFYEFKNTQQPYSIKYSVLNMHMTITYFKIESHEIRISF